MCKKARGALTGIGGVKEGYMGEVVLLTDIIGSVGEKVFLLAVSAVRL